MCKGWRDCRFISVTEETDRQTTAKRRTVHFCCWKSNCCEFLKGQAKHIDAVCRGSDTHTLTHTNTHAHTHTLTQTKDVFHFVRKAVDPCSQPHLISCFMGIKKRSSCRIFFFYSSTDCDSLNRSNANTHCHLLLIG